MISGWRAAVARTAWANVTASTPQASPPQLEVLLAMLSSCCSGTPARSKAARVGVVSQRGTWKPEPVSVEMSLLRPMTNSRMIEREADHARPLHHANGIRFPRTFSASAQKT